MNGTRKVISLLLCCVCLLWWACSRAAAIRNATDAARAVCCLARIKEGKTPEAAETVCSTIEAVSPFVAKTEAIASDAGTTD